MSNQMALSPEHQNLVETFVSCGRYDGPHAVITAALNLLREKERERTAKLSALHAKLAAEPHHLMNLDATSSEIERLLARGIATRQPACAVA